MWHYVRVSQCPQMFLPSVFPVFPVCLSACESIGFLSLSLSLLAPLKLHTWSLSINHPTQSTHLPTITPSARSVCTPALSPLIGRLLFPPLWWLFSAKTQWFLIFFVRLCSLCVSPASRLRPASLPSFSTCHAITPSQLWISNPGFHSITISLFLIKTLSLSFWVRVLHFSPLC